MCVVSTKLTLPIHTHSDNQLSLPLLSLYAKALIIGVQSGTFTHILHDDILVSAPVPVVSIGPFALIWDLLLHASRGVWV